MKTFELNSDSLHKAWGGADQFWFSLNDYSIRDASYLSELECPQTDSQSAYFTSLGLIPYLHITNEEVMRSFVNGISNKKLRDALSKIDESNYVESFWKYYNIYPQLSEGYSEYEEKYVLDKAVAWCEENSINYVINK